MGQPFHEPASGPTFRGTLSGDGRPGPIEKRLGRRLIRLINPESAEGVRLLSEGRVDLLGPDGTRMGTVRSADALRRLRQRREQRGHGEIAAFEKDLALQGIDRLDELRGASINVQEMENLIFAGAEAACARIRFDGRPDSETLRRINEIANVLNATVIAL